MEATNTNSGVMQKRHLLKGCHVSHHWKGWRMKLGKQSSTKLDSERNAAQIIVQKSNEEDTLTLTIPVLHTNAILKTMLLLLWPLPSHKIGSSWFLLLCDTRPISEHLIELKNAHTWAVSYLGTQGSCVCSSSSWKWALLPTKSPTKIR